MEEGPVNVSIPKTLREKKETGWQCTDKGKKEGENGGPDDRC